MAGEVRITFSNNRGRRAIQRNILEMSRIKPLLWSVIWKLYDELEALGSPYEIESVFYPPGAFGSKSLTHPEFRAVDVEARGIKGGHLPAPLCERIAERINAYFDNFGIGMKACYYHDSGKGPHFHLQVPRVGTDNVKYPLAET